MSINVSTAIAAVPTPVQQVQTAALANTITNLSTTSRTVAIDASGNIGILQEPRSFGEIFFTGNATATTIATAGTFVQLSNSTWVSNSANVNFALNSTTGIQYTGAVTTVFYVVFNVSAQTGVNNQSCIFNIYKNGAPLSNCRATSTLSNGLPQNCVLTGIVSLAANDILTLWITNSTANNPVTVTECSFECFPVT